MAKRKIEFVEDEYYHVFNRGVDKRNIFGDKEDLSYFFKRLLDLNFVDLNKVSRTHRYRGKKIINEREDGERLVSIVAYCLLPNHFHIILKQESENGISKFMQKLGTSYTMYFNEKNKRTGSLFAGKFKANHISSDFGLPDLSIYVNLNYKHHKIDPKNNLVKSSIFEYLNTENGQRVCNPEEVKKAINEIGSLEKYKEYAKNTSKVFASNKGLELKDKDYEPEFDN